MNDIAFDYLTKFISSFIMMSSTVYIWNKLLNTKFRFINSKTIITITLLSIISILNYYIVNQYIRIAIITLILMVSFKFLFDSSLHTCIITPIFSQLIIMISEMIFALLVMAVSLMFGYDGQILWESYFGGFLSNLMITILAIGIIHIKIIHKIYNLLLSLTDKINDIQLSIFCLIVIVASNIFAMITYYKIKFQYLLIFNVIMTLICFSIVIYTLKTKNNYNKVSDKYNIAIKSLKDYENMMSKYRVANHENKNLLKTIRAMIINKEKDIPKYIDSIVEEKYEDDEKLLFNMSVIPSGGLRATIYSEILKIKEKKINYTLDIDRKLRAVDLIELDTDTIIDICKIIGVFIDNSIEAVSSLKSKNIIISLFVDNNNLNIKVSNNYKGKIDVEKIYNEGYTTKGKGHGYGLPLVKQIVNSNNGTFKNTTEISKELFSQLLIVKYKKSH